MRLVLSVFPGIGLLDMAFEQEGFCVVRGPDVLWGGDIRRFHPPAGKFDGVIGGPPCQRFSPIGNVNRARWGDDSVMPDLTPEFSRVVMETQPAWWLMENSPRCPGVSIGGHRFDFDNEWLGEAQSRARAFWSNIKLAMYVELPALVSCVAGSERTVSSKGSVDWKGSRAREPKRTISDMLALQGLDREWLLDCPLTIEGMKKAIGNGVPLPMGRAIAKAVKEATENNP